MKKSELKRIIKETISDLTQNNLNEQNEGVRQYLRQLQDFEETYVDTLDDLENLATAVESFHRSLINRIKQEKGNVYGDWEA